MKRNVPLTLEQIKAYDSMKKNAVAVLQNSQTTAASALAQMVRLHQITCGHLKTDSGEVKHLKNNRVIVMISNKLEKYFQKDMEKKLWSRFMVTLLRLTGRILLLGFRIEKTLYDFLSEILEQVDMVSLLLLAIPLFIIVIAMI